MTPMQMVLSFILIVITIGSGIFIMEQHSRSILLIYLFAAVLVAECYPIIGIIFAIGSVICAVLSLIDGIIITKHVMKENEPKRR